MLTPGFPLLDIVLPSIEEVSSNKLTPEKKDIIKAHVLEFIEKKKDLNSLRIELISYPSILHEVEHVASILDTQNHKPHSSSNKRNYRNEPYFNQSLYHNGTERCKTHHWSEYEDNRLLMGIRIYGLDNWNAVAKYVGNGRVRGQCMQRWARGLDPRLSKKQWTSEEEQKLISLVQQYKEKSWTKIATHFGNRSDVQCRYKYQQLERAKKIPPLNLEVPEEKVLPKAHDEKLQTEAEEPAEVAQETPQGDKESKTIDDIISQAMKELMNPLSYQEIDGSFERPKTAEPPQYFSQCNDSNTVSAKNSNSNFGFFDECPFNNMDFSLCDLTSSESFI